MDVTTKSRIVSVDPMVLALLMGSLALNVYLGVARVRPTPPPERPRVIASGSTAPAFEGSTLAGQKVTLRYDQASGSTLLYVFSPTCHWCERNADNIRSIIKSRPDMRVVGVAIGPPLDAAAASKLPFAEIVKPTARTASAYGLSGTPTTILVSREGKVVNAWSGAYAGPIADEISKVLAVTLPGLSGE